MSGELVHAHEMQDVLPVSVIKSHVQSIAQMLEDLMIENTHFGKTPGCKKVCLFKPGAEKICSMFRISPQYDVEETSHGDFVRYRIRCRGVSQSGLVLGEGNGEAWSYEDKYKWRSAVCQEEFDETPSDRRRSKWKNGKSGAYQVNQVRTEAADIANTILKMAEKRALVGMVRTVTGCSDIFDQDLDDTSAPMPEAKPAEPAPMRRPQAIQQPQAQPPAQAAPSGNVITEPQRRRLYAISMSAGLDNEFVKKHLKEKYGFDSSTEITRDAYEEICNWAESHGESS